MRVPNFRFQDGAKSRVVSDSSLLCLCLVPAGEEEEEGRRVDIGIYSHGLPHPNTAFLRYFFTGRHQCGGVGRVVAMGGGRDDHAAGAVQYCTCARVVSAGVFLFFTFFFFL